MQRAEIVKEKMKENDKLFLSIHALPQAQRMLGPPLSSILLGERNTLIARLLAEQLAKTTETIALVSVFAKTLTEKEASSVFLKLFRKTLKKRSRRE